VSVAVERGERGLAGASLRQWAPAAALLLALLLTAVTVKLVLDAAAGQRALVPASPNISSWLRGPGQRLDYRDFLILLLVFSGAYAGLLALRGALPARASIALVAALHVVVFAGPILLSTDVFSYIAYARMGVEHGLNPYTHGPIAIMGDPIYRYVGVDWKHVATAYGPLYTLITYPLAPLGLRGALWGMKVEALVGSAVTLWLVWRCARTRGYDPAWALLAVGANPLYLIYGLGGAHNDLLMLMAMMAAVSFTFRRRDAAAAASVVAGALIKVTVAALLPFMLLARRERSQLLASRERSLLLGTAGALAVGAVAAFAAFGAHGLDVVAALNRDAAFVSTDSFPTEIAHLFGKPGVFPVDHDLLKAALVIIVVHLLWRTWHGFDWVAAAGWTLLAISVTSTWLLAWYLLWPLPLAVIARDRRLLVATLAVQVLFIVHQLAPLLAPVS
jgi:Glycosyltransferase family 87